MNSKSLPTAEQLAALFKKAETDGRQKIRFLEVLDDIFAARADELIEATEEVIAPDLRSDFIESVQAWAIALDTDDDDADYPEVFCVPLTVFSTEPPTTLQAATIDKLVAAWRSYGFLPEGATVTFAQRVYRLDDAYRLSYAEVRNDLGAIISASAPLPDTTPTESSPGLLTGYTRILLGLVVSPSDDDAEEEFTDEERARRQAKIEDILAADLQSDHIVALPPLPFYDGLTEALATQSSVSVSTQLSNFAKRHGIASKGLRGHVSLHDMFDYMQVRIGVSSRLTDDFVGGVLTDLVARTESELNVLMEAVTDAIAEGLGEIAIIEDIQDEHLDARGEPLFFAVGGILRSAEVVSDSLAQDAAPGSRQTLH